MPILPLPPNRLAVIAAIAFTISYAGLAGAQTVLIEHVDDNDPVAEGWSTVGAGVGVITGPVTNDLGSGVDAWSVDDTTTATDSVRFYGFDPSGSEVGDAVANGWRYEIGIRVVDTPENPDRATFADFIDDTTRWRMDFGSDVSGDPQVLLQTGLDGLYDTGILYTLVGGGSGYHTYELRYDPVAGDADLFIDGVERVSGYTGFANASGGPRITFGAGQATETGHGHFSLARFTIAAAPSAVPALSAVPLVVLGCALVAGAMLWGRGTRFGFARL